MLQEHNSVHLPESAGEDDGSQEYDEGIQLDDDDDPGPYLDSQQYDSAQTYQGEDYPTEDHLQLCFVPQTHHYEFWDMREQDLFVCYAQLQLLFKDPARWNKSRGKPECPEPKFVRLECSIAPTTPRDTRYDPHNDYRVRYGIPCPDCTGIRSRQFSLQDIWIDSGWERLYGRPPPNWGSNRRYNLGWYLRLRIPLEKKSFEKKHTRIFQVTSEICFHRWYNGQMIAVTAMTSRPVKFTVSHLSLISPHPSVSSPVPHGTACSTGSTMVSNCHISCADWERVESMFARVPVNRKAIPA